MKRILTLCTLALPMTACGQIHISWEPKQENNTLTRVDQQTPTAAPKGLVRVSQNGQRVYNPQRAAPLQSGSLVRVHQPSQNAVTSLQTPPSNRVYPQKQTIVSFGEAPQPNYIIVYTATIPAYGQDTPYHAENLITQNPSTPEDNN